ncbi:MAG TPA: glycosyltransferase 87 family protein [Candidatus Krumholzibacteria bacterium]|nr:glycosyltransferase 87 family protein [Candidatus Krumholzibacteria bacterium]
MVVLHQRRNKLAAALGVSSVGLYGLMAFSVTGPIDTREWLLGYAIAWGLYLSLFVAARDDDWIGSPWLILGWALIARLVLVPTAPWLSDDLYRYLLDGRVLAEGVNPFAHPPAEPMIQSIAPELASKVNHPEVPTIYPPVVQGLAWIAARMELGVVGWRVLMTGIDLLVMGAVALLFGRGARGWRAAAVYGLCPLAIWETGANGHLEALAALPLVLGVFWMERGHPLRAGVAFGAAALTKYYALLLLPLWLAHRGFKRMAATTVAVTLLALVPFTVGGVDIFEGLRTYLANWSFNSPLYSVLANVGIPDDVLRVLPFVVILIGGTVAGLRNEDVVRSIPMLLFAFLVIGPTLHPWYALWLLPWLGDRPHPGHWSFVGAMGGAYAVWWSVATTGQWTLPTGVPEVLWTIVALGWLSSFWRETGSTPEPV